MDWLPILLGAATTFGNAALNEGAKRTIGDAWDAVRNAVVRKFGAAHDAPRLLDQLKTPPAGMTADQVGARLMALPLGSDPDITRALEALSAAVKANGAAATNVTAKTVYGAQVNHGQIEIRIGSDH
jgi:hypothetical protein